jgi:hypothetical protein
MVIPVALVAIAIFLYLKNHFENKREEIRYTRLEHQQETLERTLRAIRKKNEKGPDSGADGGKENIPDTN